METILDKIVIEKRREVEVRKTKASKKSLEKSSAFSGDCYSMKEFIKNPELGGIIAEIKRKSPSKGIINDNFSVEEVSAGYVNAGASGLSVLTDNIFFGGSNEDLICARKVNGCPILRKDFIVDEYQIFEAKSIGADMVLLIAACLSPDEIQSLSLSAKSLGMEVLLEVHNEQELNQSLNDNIDMVGVNNRDLKTFKTVISTSYELAEKIPNRFLKISESGLQEPETLIELGKVGFEGFLMGEHFMKYKKPQEACGDFISRLRKLKAVEKERI